MKVFHNKNSSQFSLRFGAVSVIPGYSVRRHSYCTSNSSHEKNVKCTDASFLTGKYRGSLCDMVAPFTDNEIILDVFSIDAENEIHNSQTFCFETRQHVLGRRKFGDVDIFDRFTGITRLQEK